MDKQDESAVLVPGLVGFFGANGTLKTSEAMRWPHKVAIKDMELGSGRAWEIREAVEAGLVEVEEFQLPVKDLSRRYSKLTGQRELWNAFNDSMSTSMEDPEIRTVVIDTGTSLWQLIRDAYLQELQEAEIRKNPRTSENDLRKQLLQIEHGEPNRRMDHIVQMAKIHKKWVILIHHDTDQYVPITAGGHPVIDTQTGQPKMAATGKRIADGWRRTGPALDWQFESIVNDLPSGVPEPTFTIREKTAGGIFLRNMVFTITPGRGKMSLFRSLELANGSELTEAEKEAAEKKAKVANGD